MRSWLSHVPRFWETGALLILSGLLLSATAWGAPGDIQWKFQAGTKFDTSPAVADDGTLYIGSDDGYLYAVYPDGVERWKFQTGDAVVSSPAIGTDGVIYIGSNDNLLYAVNPGGTEKWRFSTGGNIEASPAIGPDGTIYAASKDGILYAVKDKDDSASELWRFNTGSSLVSSPAVEDDGVVYFGAENGKLYAVDTSTGSANWEYKTGGDAITSSPAVDANKVVYVGADDGLLYAVEDQGDTRAFKWTAPTGGAIESSPVIDGNGIIYVGSDDKQLYAFTSEGKTASGTWPFETGNSIKAAPAIGSEGNIYFASLDGTLYCIKTDGTQVWSATISPSYSSPVLTADKVLYIGTRLSAGTGSTQVGVLYAVETDSAAYNTLAPWPLFGHDVRRTGRNNANQSPVANAGEDLEAIDGQSITLSGNNSTDPDFGIASYAWRQTEGETVTLTNADTIEATFTAPGVEESLIFELTVTDYGNKTSTDTVTVKITKDDNFCFIQTAENGF